MIPSADVARWSRIAPWPDGFNAEAALEVAERFLMATE